jgi:DNA-binding Lrp family transcriptional regulator
MNLMSNLIIEMPRRESSTKNLFETEEPRESVSSNREPSARVKRGTQIATENAISRVSTDAKIIKALTEGQPVTLQELEHATGVTRETLKDRTKRLNEVGMIKETPRGWALSDYEPINAKVNEALKKLRLDGYANITLQNVSHKTRLPPKVIEVAAYLLAPNHGLTIAETPLKLDLSVDETSLKRV